MTLQAPAISSFNFRGHSCQYAKFRDEKFFLDCEYHDGKQSYKAHKLVLSVYSTLLRNHFANKAPDSNDDSILYQLPIPFNSSMFENLVKYFYDTYIKLDKIDSSQLLPWLSMGYIYDVKTINEIIIPIITERFLLNPKDDYLDKILQFSEYYKKVRLDPVNYKEFDGIEENLQKFMESQRLFVSYLGKQFDIIEKDRKKLSKLTPFLISEILKNKNDYDDIRKAVILENYVKVLRIGKEELTIHDRKILQEVISWDKENSYELFTYSDLDWVLPEVARPQIVKLFRARRKTLKSLDLNPSIQNEKEINHWYAISCINDIETARENTDESYSIIHFIGTLGNSHKVNYLNPKKYHFLKSDFSPSLSESMYYGDLSIYDEIKSDPKVYFLSKCEDMTKPSSIPPYAGFELPASSIKINKVILSSTCQRKNNRPQQMSLILDGNYIGVADLVDTQIIFNLEESLVAKKIRLQASFPNSKKPESFALRVDGLQVIGKFLPQV